MVKPAKLWTDGFVAFGNVGLEYEILEYLLRPVPYRFVDYEIEKQQLICHEDRYLDAITVKVYSHPLLIMGENGRLHRTERTFLGTEEYWFDITAGYRNRLGSKPICRNWPQKG